MPPVRFDRLAHLTESKFLEPLFGPVRAVEQQAMRAPGFSGARFERVTVVLGVGATRTLVLKLVNPRSDWTSRLTGDVRGREALVLDSAELAPVWDTFACPYLAWAREGDALGLLMQDLGPHLLPDVREPLPLGVETRLLDALARMHARFWNATPDSGSGLGDAERLAGVLSPAVAASERARDPDSPLFRRVAEGWGICEARLAPASWDLVRDGARVFAERSAGLPLTLLHGDSKVANFAPFPDGRVAAFDWAMATRGPVAIELGYYLAMNASRLADSREGATARYRERLESALGEPIAPADWSLTVDLAALASAALVLWSKAHLLEAGSPGAADQWAWYEAELERLARVWA
jgi:hypothetical protein